MISKLKIGSSIYDVILVDELKDCRNNDLHGEIDYGNLKINICTKYPKYKQLQSILHEAIHGISDEYQLDFDEKISVILSNVIYAFIIDNKEYVKMVQNGSS